MSRPIVALSLALLLAQHVVVAAPFSDACFSACLVAAPSCALSSTTNLCSCASAFDVDTLQSCVQSCGSLATTPLPACTLSSASSPRLLDLADVADRPSWLRRWSTSAGLLPRMSKAQKAKLAAEKNARTWGIIGGVLGACVIAFFSAAFWRKHRREQKEVRNERFSRYSQWVEQQHPTSPRDKMAHGGEEIPWVPPHERQHQYNVPLPIMPPQAHAYKSPRDMNDTPTQPPAYSMQPQRAREPSLPPYDPGRTSGRSRSQRR